MWSMQDNQVFITGDDIIEIQVVGDQSVESVDAMGVEVKRLAARLRAKGRRVLIIDNVLRLGQVSPDVRRRVAELGKVLDYDKLAMVGSGNVLRLGANLMLRAVGKDEKLKYFEDYQAAVAWLQA